MMVSHGHMPFHTPFIFFHVNTTEMSATVLQYTTHTYQHQAWIEIQATNSDYLHLTWNILMDNFRGAILEWVNPKKLKKVCNLPDEYLGLCKKL